MLQMTSPTLQARRAQVFPVLSAEEIQRLRRFGSMRRFADGERVIEAGKPAPGLLVVLNGVLRITGRDLHGRPVEVVDHTVGSFAGEVGQLSGQASFVDGVALGDLEALVIEPAQLRAVLVAEALLGEQIMRALILRRVGLLETGVGGPVLIGAASGADVVRLRGFLTRNGIPHLLLDPAYESEARDFLARYATEARELPLVLCPDGSTLFNPTEYELARCIGMLTHDAADRVYDVVIAGAGPAGLAAAVYAASEGLSVLVVDSRAFGGQAGASAKIENYLGFPTGISGQALAGRAYTQARKFGAAMMIPVKIERLDCERSEPDEPLALRLADGGSVRSRAVVIATGAQYRRPECSNLRSLEGHGVWYWASPIEARMCAGREVVLVGGGNSAGQAAVYLSGYASKVWMLVRGASLSASMSRYLIDRIASIGNIELCLRSQIAELHGTVADGVQSVRWRHCDTGAEEGHAINHVFLFLGADPCTDWLKDCGVAVDEKSFVITGPDPQRRLDRLPLETSVRGVFAIGDARSGSVKRVGGAIGEGAAVVAQIHTFLAASSVAALEHAPEAAP